MNLDNPASKGYSDLKVGGLKRIVSNRSGARQSDMHERGPALELMVAVAMEKIRGADGKAGSAGFNESKAGVIVHGFIGEKNFLAAAAPHVESGEIVRCARGRHPREEQVVFPIPEAMFAANYGPGSLPRDRVLVGTRYVLGMNGSSGPREAHGEREQGRKKLPDVFAFRHSTSFVTAD